MKVNAETKKTKCRTRKQS